ncbi:MAG TPA: glycoside hydrolase family 9 protein [Pyrinomonadaceae bacterium]|nr:glycoside hydrolase family 9 protein [Pyrinomonadaceae bacterium]
MKKRVKNFVRVVVFSSVRVVIFCFVVAAAALAANAQSVFIRVNQLGFKPGDVKTAVAFGREPLAATFRVLDAATGTIAFTGKAVSLNGTWGEFTHDAELNFGGLRREGKYVIEVGSARSVEFAIGRNIDGDLADQLLEFMREQRCGYNPYVDAACHTFDGRTAYGPLPPGTYINASGGWHDAGDQLKYLLTSSNATAQMLLAYQLAAQSPPKPAARSPHKKIVFADRYNDLGQPGANGIADVLDEARWGLQWMLRLHPAKDQLYHQVADDRDHKGFRLPQNETVDYGWGAGSYRVVYFADGRPQGLKQFQSESNGVANLAGRYAAAMALGYQIWKDDPRLRSFAARLLQAGREVYELGRAHEGVQQGNSYGAPYRYAETTWVDDMEWGAAELFRATRDVHYLRDAERYALLAGSESWMGRQETGHYQFYPFMNLGHFRLYDLVAPRMKQQLARFYRDGLDRTVQQGATNPYHIGVPFIWCSNNLTVALATQGALYDRMTGDHRYREFTAMQFDWLLGRNPWGVSMFTGIPANGTYPRDVHLFANALLKRMVRGGLIDGPVYRKVFQSLRGVFIREPDPFAPFQDERAVYHDDINDYSTNEPTMDGTASAILMWAVR